MQHPHLIRLASVRCRISVNRLIWDAMQKQRFCTESFNKIHDRFVFLDEIPPFVEDYALNLLAKHEKQQKQTCLLYGYDEWRKR